MAGGLQYILAPSLFLYLIIICSIHPTYSTPNGFSFKLIPRDSPESPLYPGNLTQLERIQRMIKFTKARAHYLELTSSSNSTIDINSNIFLPLLRDNFFYMVQLSIGTPSSIPFLLLDTGGGLIWIQCEPCANCYPQQYPIYDSRSSNTYRKVPCDHPLCRSNTPFQCVNNECVYNINYGGGASTRGVASIERIRFVFGINDTYAIDNIVFGCSNDNRNIQFGKNGVISGVLGLSLSPDSLVSQLPIQTQKRFSYCLVPFTEAQMVPSALRFGDEIPLPSGNIYTTPFVTPPQSHYYHLSLFDISVGSRPIGFPPGTFRFILGRTLGFFIDNGALIPQLDQNAHGRNTYREVMKAFQNYYDALNLTRMGRVPEGFQLCYKYTPDFNQFSSMTYHFQDANYVVDPKHVNFYNTQAGYFCVAILPGNGKSILGAWHQQNMRITYDGNINGLQFSTEICANRQ